MRARRLLAVPGLVLAAVLVAGCSTSGGSGNEPSPSAADTGQGAFVVAAAVDPIALDPAVVTDPDSLRITRQIFETLVTLPDKPAAASPAPSPTATARSASAATQADVTTVAPGLATEWAASRQGRTYTLTLREGVTFQDGTPFGPAAVCANFDRWYTLSGRAAAPDVSAVYQEVFGGFIDQASRYQGCTELGPHQVRIDLATPMPGLLTELTRPQFGIQSPTAMADNGAYATGGDPRTTSYATAHPTGTGPFRFGAWEPGVQVVLLRNPDYWGQKAAVERVLVKTVNDPKARGEQLVKGKIDAYDQVTALETASLTADPKAGVRIERRAAGDLTYLGLDKDSTALADPRIRKAVALAIDPAAIVARTMPKGSTVANSLLPDDQGTRTYPYDPNQARRLLAEAGATNLKLRIGYPSGVQQGYLPAPEDLYVVVAEQLKAVGITAEPVAMSWPAFLQMLGGEGTRPDLHLMGVAMQTPEPSSLVSQLLAGGPQEFGLPSTSSELAGLLSQPAGAGRDAAVAAAQKQLLEDPVLVPLAHPVSVVALGPRVRDERIGPYGADRWTSIRVTG
ncbi:peptide/nickel transport system substrate-binding protein [Raineyella antarctica]|uniref:Peptide/nickel transport system substrate-binding protein n=1 Tax=Raineyella antarctica TaxID=1577474 RepID=A0A1G6GDY1_9ACTN|nr:ABC transporter substrate-binding protein [Raineyella antarctica]SDB80208.1 peptide/nickel transport system substrate-binding protein [Raineyella antarctica]